jgi:hypothetical protein
MIKVSKHVFPVFLALCLCSSGCTPDKKVSNPSLDKSAATIPAVDVAAVSPQVSKPLLPEIEFDVYAYPKAIAVQENVILESEDVHLKRDANLALVVLYMSRVNPNQDFGAASEALNHAVELDPSLADDVSIQHWLDVFALLREMQEEAERAESLEEENEELHTVIEKQKKTITYLETTLEELKKLESDVEKKRRLYR